MRFQKKLKYPNAAKDSHGRLRAGAAIAQFPVFHPLALMNANKGVFGVNLGHLWDEQEMMGEVLGELLGWWAEGRIAPVIDSTFL